VLIIVVACVFIIARWLIGLLFSAIGIPITTQVAAALALLIALGAAWGSYSYRS